MFRLLMLGCAVAGAIVFAATGRGAGGDARDQALLHSVMAGMTTDLTSVRIESLTTDGQSPAQQAKRMLVVGSTAATSPGKVLDDWYGWLIATAYNQRCGAQADHCLARYDANRINGRYARRPFAGRAYLVRQIRAALAAVGLRVSSISFEHPYALAPVVTIRSRNPQRAVYALRRAEAAMPWRHVAGSCIQMLDGHGNVFEVEASAWIQSEGWVRPDLRPPGQIEGATGRQGPSRSSDGGHARTQPGARDRALLALVMHGMKTKLLSVRIGPLGEWRSPRRAGERVLYATSTAHTSLGKVRDNWDAALIAGSYNDQCATKADHCLAAYYVEGGRGGDQIGRSGARRPFATRQSLSRAIHSRLAGVGLRVVGVSFQHPWAFAPIVTVESRHECAAVKAFDRSSALSGLGAAGWFVRFVGPRGGVFYTLAVTSSLSVSGPHIRRCPLPHL
jgi:hypothetical protein